LPTTSEAQLRAIAKYDKENYQHISFKVRIGAREKIKEAADATSQSVNGFIKTAISNAMMEAIGKPLEPTPVESAKTILLRIINEEVCQNSLLLGAPRLTEKEKKEIIEHLEGVIEENAEPYQHLLNVLTSDLPPKKKGKKLRDAESKTRMEIRDVILYFHD